MVGQSIFGFYTRMHMKIHAINRVSNSHVSTMQYWLDANIAAKAPITAKQDNRLSLNGLP